MAIERTEVTIAPTIAIVLPVIPIFKARLIIAAPTPFYINTSAIAYAIMIFIFEWYNQVSM